MTFIVFKSSSQNGASFFKKSLPVRQRYCVFIMDIRNTKQYPFLQKSFNFLIETLHDNISNFFKKILRQKN